MATRHYMTPGRPATCLSYDINSALFHPFSYFAPCTPVVFCFFQYFFLISEILSWPRDDCFFLRSIKEADMVDILLSFSSSSSCRRPGDKED